MRTRRLIAVVVAGLLAGPMTTGAGARASAPPLDDFLRSTMDGLAFQEVLDLAPPARSVASLDKEAAPRVKALADPQPISQQPQIDATVLELDGDGRITGSATVLMSPQYPNGVIVPVDDNQHTTAVRWRQWDDAGWYANHAQGTIDVVPGRENAPLDFMSPYPASVLKLMVGFGVLRLVDQGTIALDDTYAYEPATISSLCGPASRGTIRDYLDKSLTESSNAASCALIKMLWDHNAVAGLNQSFQDLGLETLQLKNTNPVNGGRWGNPVTMSSLDTAKLLAIVNGGPGTLWTTPAGMPVTRDVLSDASRELFLRELGDQGWNWMLSTPNYCGRDYPAAGIPQRVADRWIGPDGKVTVAGSAFGQDVRPCNEAAEVTFAHKPGWVNNTGSDAGIVKSLPGKAERHYIIAVFSNLGDQYQDPGRPATPPGTVPVEYTQKFAQLGAALDGFEAARG
ncbi:serine hydrolase [Actinoplanes sp. NPDC049265]|uniref:serine hydrolase n=1 Tax=Actinoplanes sp. NPDC049265 TaxID=3363902 RepID=UPI00371B340F